MRIIFCDDNNEVLNQLIKYVKAYFQSLKGIMPEFASYSNGDELLRNENTADIAFLDVEMPGTSGIHVGAELKRRNAHIKIFIVTSYPDYLDEAMRFQVFRYLSKPIDKNRLFRNLKDAVYQYNMETFEVAIQTEDALIVRPADEIICVEYLQRKTLLNMTDGVLQSVNPIEYWRETLTLPSFYITYRSFIVNMRYVHTINRDSVTLRCNNIEKVAYLSRRKYSAFKDTYLTYLESIR